MTGSPERPDNAAEQAAYDAFHRRRIDVLLDACRALALARDVQVLDVGRSSLSTRLTALYDTVWTLGYPVSDPHKGGFAGHVAFDLNDCFGGAAPAADRRFDLIVFAETIEHLVAPPERALAALASLLAPGGAIICQTPNAAALGNRVKLLFGRNPYERLRDTPGNLGHIRESTRSELFDFARKAGLRVERHGFHEYFGRRHQSALRRLAEIPLRLASLAVPAFRRGQMAVFRPA